MPPRDGMALETFRDAVDFRADGIPDPWKWVDELAAKLARESLRGA